MHACQREPDIVLFGGPHYGAHVMRRAQMAKGRVAGSNRVGVNQPRQRPMTRLISAPIGERAKRRRKRAQDAGAHVDLHPGNSRLVNPADRVKHDSWCPRWWA